MDRSRREASAAEWGVGATQKAEGRRQKAGLGINRIAVLIYTTKNGVLYESEHNERVSEFPRLWCVAKKLMSGGCLWNSFVMVGRVGAFLEMFREHVPEMFRMFAASAPLFGTHQEEAVIRSIYSWIPETNYSSEVLERSAEKLLVMRVGEVGWSDWGDPHRVVGTLSNLGIQTEWMHAMAA